MLSRFEQSQMCRTSNDNEVFVGLVPSTAGEFNLVNEFIALDGLLYSPQSAVRTLDALDNLWGGYF